MSRTSSRSHRCGNEAAWWSKTGIDPTIAARALWFKTHPLPAISDNITTAAASSPRMVPIRIMQGVVAPLANQGRTAKRSQLLRPHHNELVQTDRVKSRQMRSRAAGTLFAFV